MSTHTCTVYIHTCTCIQHREAVLSSTAVISALLHDRTLYIYPISDRQTTFLRSHADCEDDRSPTFLDRCEHYPKLSPYLTWEEGVHGGEGAGGREAFLESGTSMYVRVRTVQYSTSFNGC